MSTQAAPASGTVIAGSPSKRRKSRVVVDLPTDVDDPPRQLAAMIARLAIDYFPCAGHQPDGRVVAAALVYAKGRIAHHFKA